MHSSLTYAIIAVADIDSVDFSQVGENSADTVRRSVDGTKFVIKWDTEPTFIADGTIVPLSILSYEACLDLMDTPEWTEPEE